MYSFIHLVGVHGSSKLRKTTVGNIRRKQHQTLHKEIHGEVEKPHKVSTRTPSVSGNNKPDAALV